MCGGQVPHLADGRTPTMTAAAVKQLDHASGPVKGTERTWPTLMKTIEGVETLNRGLCG